MPDVIDIARVAAARRRLGTAPRPCRRRALRHRACDRGGDGATGDRGLKLSDFRPAGSDDAVDIVLRLPPDQRTIAALDELRIQTAEGSVPDLELRDAEGGADDRHADPDRQRSAR